MSIRNDNDGFYLELTEEGVRVAINASDHTNSVASTK